MKPFTTFRAVAAPLMRDNVDTDAILPAPWMRSALRDPAEGLFRDWQFLQGDEENPDFVLNRSGFRRSGILLAGRNFGCGSSRENAVWALSSFGIRCVIALGFSETFVENCFRNGILTVVLDEPPLLKLAEEAGARVNAAFVTVDLPAQVIYGPGGWATPFAIDSYRRDTLIAGLDEIERTLARRGDIAAFQAADRAERPWVYLDKW